jgi:hypothetical protein
MPTTTEEILVLKQVFKDALLLLAGATLATMAMPVVVYYALKPEL